MLSPEEIRRLWCLWEAEGSQISVVYRLLLTIGQRKTLVTTMRWAHVTFPWWSIPRELSKNRQPHLVFLGPRATALLGSLRRADSPWVFPSERVAGQALGWVNKARERYSAQSGIQNFRPHDLRRTMATEMGDLGISSDIIALVLGHHRGGVTAIYDRAKRMRQIQEALLAWDQRLGEILRGEESDRGRLLGFPAVS